ncbi:MAG: hypothetical protein LQ348_007826, partial [Seirophora lacunosa]
ALDRASALKLFTAWPAYASFREADLGTIAVGKRADLTAFSVDLMTAPVETIPRGRAVLTMEDLGCAVGEYGVNVKRAEFYR